MYIRECIRTYYSNTSNHVDGAMPCCHRWSGDLLPEDGMGSSLLYGIHQANCVMAEADAMVVRASAAVLWCSLRVL